VTDRTHDVLIVGAGVMGASTSFHLASRGSSDVLVLDQGAAGSGMSNRSSALIRMHYTFPLEVQLAVRSDDMFERWPEFVGAPKFVRRTGFVRLVLPGEESQLRENVRMQRELGADTRLVEADELAAVAPGLSVEGVALAAYEPNGGFGDGAVAAGDFLTAARRHGVTFRPTTPVRSLLRDGDRVVGVKTDEGPEYAGTVVLATGIWSRPLLSECGFDPPIEGELHHVAILKNVCGGAPLACIDSTTGTYFRPEGSGSTTLVGSFSGIRPSIPDDADGPIDQDLLAELVAAASRRLPALENAGVLRGISGVYDMTPDARPMIGCLPELEGLVMAIGFSGMGFKISPAVGEAVADLVVSAGPSWIDLHPFRPTRFVEGEPIVSPFPYSDD
jgi:sarcosine oxidase subunit beta